MFERDSDNPEPDLSSEPVRRLLQQIVEHLAVLREQQGSAAREWLTISEVARMLRVSNSTIERLIGSGKLQATAIRTPNARGRRKRYRIRREWVERYLLEQTESPRRARRRAGFDYVD